MNILLVEDNPGDVVLLREALTQAGLPHNMIEAGDGLEALEILANPPFEGKHPDIILLDLNLPRMNGREVIRRLNADPALKRIPLVVLTTSREEMHIIAGREHDSAMYLVKPPTFNEFLHVVHAVWKFWHTHHQPKNPPADQQ